MMLNYTATFSELLKHPCNVIDSFLQSEESEFMHPFLFLILGAAAITLVNTLLVDFSYDPVLTEFEAENEQLRESSGWIQTSTVRATTQFMPITAAFLLVPMLSAAGLIFFREYLSGFYVQLVLNSYAVGAAMVFQLVLIPVWLFSGIPLSDPLANTLLPAIVVAFAILRIYLFYIADSSLLFWVRVISTYVVGYLFYTTLARLTAGVIGFMIYAILRIGELSGSM